MSIKIEGKTYYKTYEEAYQFRKMHERIMYEPYYGYYISAAPTKREFWRGFK